MALVRPFDRVKGTTSTEGTGDLTLDLSAAEGFRSFQDAMTDGQSTACFIGQGEDWEISLCTKTGSTLARGTVLDNSNGTTSKIAFGPGTKEVFQTAPSAWLAYKALINEWLLDQYFRGKVVIGESNTNYLSVASNVLAVTLVNAVALEVLAGSIRKTMTDGAIGSGPTIQLERSRPTPAVDDLGPALLMRMNDLGGTQQTLGRVVTRMLAATAGAASGGLDFYAMNGGAEQLFFRIMGNAGCAFPSAGVLVGKSTFSDNSIVGVEVTTSGRVIAAAAGSAPFVANRKNSDGFLIDLLRDGTSKGGVTVSGETVSISAFHGTHWSRAPEGRPLPDDIAIGTLLSTVDEHYGEGMMHLARAEVTKVRGCRRVYGVFGGWIEPDQEIDGEVWQYPRQKGDFLVSGLGTPTGVLVEGPVRGGDLLMSSDTPGVAIAQADDLVRAHTLGKVVIGDDRDDVRLVRAVIYAG